MTRMTPGAPALPARNFTPGTRKRGADGKLWVCVSNRIGACRWKPVVAAISGAISARTAHLPSEPVEPVPKERKERRPRTSSVRAREVIASDTPLASHTSAACDGPSYLYKGKDGQPYRSSDDDDYAPN